MKKQCAHQFVPTGNKGKWTVKVKSASLKGAPRSESVNTTIFKCAGCGTIKEYPDTWEKNYIAP